MQPGVTQARVLTSDLAVPTFRFLRRRQWTERSQELPSASSLQGWGGATLARCAHGPLYSAPGEQRPPPWPVQGACPHWAAVTSRSTCSREPHVRGAGWASSCCTPRRESPPTRPLTWRRPLWFYGHSAFSACPRLTVVKELPSGPVQVTAAGRACGKWGVGEQQWD